jgi:hypothetical protein
VVLALLGLWQLKIVLRSIDPKIVAFEVDGFVFGSVGKD